jgi:hypothetical protein
MPSRFELVEMTIERQKVEQEDLHEGFVPEGRSAADSRTDDTLRESGFVERPRGGLGRANLPLVPAICR